jgi:hypothetical protein
MQLKKEKIKLNIEKEVKEEPLKIQSVDEYLAEVKQKDKLKKVSIPLKPIKAVPEHNIMETKAFSLNDDLKKGFVSSTQLKIIMQDQKIYDFDYKKYYSKFSPFYWINNYKLKKLRRKIFLILMHLKNGKYDLFIVTTNKGFFEKYDGLYFIDPDMAREDTFTKLPMLYYHQDISIPFKIDFDIDALHKKVAGDKQEQAVDKALNPSSLKGFINSQVIEKVLRGQDLADEMKFIKILIIISLLLQAIIGFMIGKSMGWFG